jgi:catechol 2,3-dioxygenase-like lactoylglutathione lyase family enzyme
MSKIALEEHFVFPDFLGYLSEAMPHVTHESYDQLIKKLSDFGDERLAAMDAAGVTFAVLSLSGSACRSRKIPRKQSSAPGKLTICWPNR